jgi:protein-S-isoprenylcysteine O-methyltransferase Ste14
LPAWIGAVVLAIGTALKMTAQAQMGASWRIGIDADAPSELVTRGYGFPVLTLCRMDSRSAQ